MTIAEIILLGPGQGNTVPVLGDTYTCKAGAKDTMPRRPLSDSIFRTAL